MNLWSNVFRHHRWSNRAVIDCLSTLTDDQLALTVPDTFGSSLATVRHLVSSDADAGCHRSGQSRGTRLFVCGRGVAER